jgi:hypothetical protein
MCVVYCLYWMIVSNIMMWRYKQVVCIKTATDREGGRERASERERRQDRDRQRGGGGRSERKRETEREIERKRDSWELRALSSSDYGSTLK